MKLKIDSTHTKLASTKTRSSQLSTGTRWLLSLFLDRKARNPSYSTRAFARDLGMSQSFLSRVLTGKRTLTLKKAFQISGALGLSKAESERFLHSVVMALPENAKSAKKIKQKAISFFSEGADLFVDYGVEQFKAISQWHHIAILDLTRVKGFKSDSAWIASRLGITQMEVKDAIERLLYLELLKQDSKGALKKVHPKMYFKVSTPVHAVRKFHKQMITKALAQLDKTHESDYSKREISSITLSVSPNKIEKARELIQKFQKQFTDEVTDDDPTEVYQLNVQFFPLTISKKGDLS